MDGRRNTTSREWLSPSHERYPPPRRRRRRDRWSSENNDWRRSPSESRGQRRRSPMRKRQRRDYYYDRDSRYRRYEDRYEDEHDYSSQRRYRRDDDDQEDRTRSRRRRRRREDDDSSMRHRRRRHRRRDQSATSSSSSDFHHHRHHVAAAPPVRAGVVSDDEQQQEHSFTPPRHEDRKKRASMSAASSAKDDTVGHFRGGPGTVIANRYRVTGDVGMGTFGRVVECLDLKYNKKSRSSRKRSFREGDRDERVAIKIVRNVKRYYDSALIEADIVRDVNRRGGRGRSHCAIMHNAFTFSGHFCLVFECMGPSLYDFLKRHEYQPFPMVCVRHFCRQLLETLEFLHSFDLIHTDLKPENILLTNYRERSYKWRGRTYQIPESTQIKVIDFGGATYDNEKKSSVVNTRQYRAPEVILGLGWSTPSDLWSAGCILAELYMGELLFATHDNIEHLALMERIIGGFPRRLIKRANKKNSKSIAQEAFDSCARHLLDRVLPHESMAHVKRMKRLEKLIHEDDYPFLVLLRRLLVIDPEERAPASELVQYRL